MLDLFNHDVCPYCGAPSEARGLLIYCRRCGRTQAYLPEGAHGPPSRAGLWRQGKVLVMHKSATLPRRCVKTNRPATRFISYQFHWMHPGWIAAIFGMMCFLQFGLIGAIIVCLVVQKKAAAVLPFSDEAMALQRRGVLNGVTAFAASFVFFPCARIAGSDTSALWILDGIVAVAMSLFFIRYYGKLVSVQRIGDHCIFIKGVCPEFLSELPEVY